VHTQKLSFLQLVIQGHTRRKGIVHISSMLLTKTERDMSASLEIPSVLQIIRRNTGSKPSIPSRSAKASSGYRGVSSQGNRWRARICIDKVEYTIGDFDTEDEAAQAYDIEAIKRGKLKYLNFVYKGLNDKPPEAKKRKQARKRKLQAGDDVSVSSNASKTTRATQQSSPSAHAAKVGMLETVTSIEGKSQDGMQLPLSFSSAQATAEADNVRGVLHIPKETNPNLKARPKVRNRNGKKYARVADTSFMSADARYFPADFARASGDLFDPARGFYADTSVHEAQQPLYSMYSAGVAPGPSLPKAPPNAYFSMSHAAPSKAGAVIVNHGSIHNQPVGGMIPITSPPAPPLTGWGRMSAQAQHLANSFANSTKPAVSSFGKSNVSHPADAESMEAVDRVQALQLLNFFHIPQVKIVLSDEMRHKLKYVVLTGGPQVLTMIDAAVEVFQLTSDIHELLDTLGHVYRVWMNAALAMGLFGDYVPYMFARQGKVDVPTAGKPSPPATLDTKIRTAPHMHTSSQYTNTKDNKVAYESFQQLLHEQAILSLPAATSASRPIAQPGAAIQDDQGTRTEDVLNCAPETEIAQL
jgi:hypothetical protein